MMKMDQTVLGIIDVCFTLKSQSQSFARWARIKCNVLNSSKWCFCKVRLNSDTCTYSCQKGSFPFSEWPILDDSIPLVYIWYYSSNSAFSDYCFPTQWPK